MITPSSLPQNRYSQGIVCTSPSMTITPYLTDSWSFALPRESITYQKIYDADSRVRDVEVCPKGVIYVALEDPGRIVKIFPFSKDF